MHTCTASLPSLPQPYLISKGSSWVQIGWEPLDCDGGYQVNSYRVEYRSGRFYSYTIADYTSALNLTVHSLSHSTQYSIRVVAISAVSTRTSTSPIITVTTHPAGIE